MCSEVGLCVGLLECVGVPITNLGNCSKTLAMFVPVALLVLELGFSEVSDFVLMFFDS